MVQLTHKHSCIISYFYYDSSAISREMCPLLNESIFISTKDNDTEFFTELCICAYF